MIIDLVHFLAVALVRSDALSESLRGISHNPTNTSSTPLQCPDLPRRGINPYVPHSERPRWLCTATSCGWLKSHQCILQLQEPTISVYGHDCQAGSPHPHDELVLLRSFMQVDAIGCLKERIYTLEEKANAVTALIDIIFSFC